MPSANRSIPVPAFNRQQRRPAIQPVPVSRQPRDLSNIFRTPMVAPPDGEGKVLSDEELEQRQINEEVERFCNLLTYVVISIPFFEMSANAKIPAYAHNGDACLDLYACLEEEVVIYQHQRTIVPTGVGVMLPPSFELQVRPRSGNASKKGLTVLNTPGTIDSNYRGIIGVILYNTGEDKVVIKHGDAIAQGKIAWAPKVNVVKINREDATQTERGAKGFGSSGLVGG